jgi:hypothetical protein
LRRDASVPVNLGAESPSTGATRSCGPAGTLNQGGAKNAVKSVLEPNRLNGASPDLDCVRGLIPAVVLGVAFWAIILAIGLLIWG